MSAGLPQHLTLDYLRALLSRGVEKTTVTEEARMVLRKWVMDARRICGPPPLPFPPSLPHMKHGRNSPPRSRRLQIPWMKHP